MYINTHTHSQIYDAQIEVVSLNSEFSIKPKYYSFGVHPRFIDAEKKEDQILNLKFELLNPACIALGECGLDKLCDTSLDLQEEIFIKQIKIANENNKPLIIHCVRAFNELINCLNDARNKMPVIIHGYNNNENIASILMREDYYFSFGKALLGFDSNASRVIKSVGRKKIFLETDAADISIKYIYKKASEILGIDEPLLQEQIENNFESVFNFKLK